jgi:hypothetical protein
MYAEPLAWFSSEGAGPLRRVPGYHLPLFGDLRTGQPALQQLTTDPGGGDFQTDSVAN